MEEKSNNDETRRVKKEKETYGPYPFALGHLGSNFDFSKAKLEAVDRPDKTRLHRVENIATSARNTETSIVIVAGTLGSWVGPPDVHFSTVVEGFGADAVFGQCWADVKDSIADKCVCPVV